MTQCAKLRPRLALMLVAALTLQGTPLFASGFQLVEQNASGLGTAHSGDAAAAEDASTIFFNPAGMTRLKGTQIAIAGNGIDISTVFTDRLSTRPYLPSTPPLPVSATLGTTGGNAGGWNFVPNAYISWQASSKAWIGVGVGAPFGLPTEWESGFMGRFHAIKSNVKTINVQPSVAFQLSQAVSIGVGANWQHLTATLTQSVPYGGIAVGAASPYGPAAVGGILAQMGGPAGLYTEGVSTLDGSSNAWGWNAGLMFSGEKARLGLTYRSKIKHDVVGTLDFGGAPSFVEEGPLGPLGAGLNQALASGPAHTDITMPDIFSAGAAFNASDKLEFLADWTWTNWSVIPELAIFRVGGPEVSTVPLKFQDTWRAGLGANFRVKPSLKLRFGVAYDKSPVQDQYRTPRLPDADRTWVATGLQFKMGKKGAFDIGYAHIFVKDATSQLPNQGAVGAPPQGNLIGTYNENVNIVSAQFTIGF